MIVLIEVLSFVYLAMLILEKPKSWTISETPKSKTQKRAESPSKLEHHFSLRKNSKKKLQN